MSGEMGMPPEVAVAVHATKIRNLEEREIENREWRESHTREDDQRHTGLGTDVSRVITGLATLNATLEPIIKAYWGEDSSKLTNKTPTSKRKAMSPELRQGSMIAGLVTAVIALAEVVKSLVHPAPPPPNTTEIATEIAKALSKEHR